MTTGLLDRLAADGVHVTLAPDGTLRTRGDRAAVARWLPAMKQHRAELVAALAPSDGWTSRRDVLCDQYHAEWSAALTREAAWLRAHPAESAPTDEALRDLLASTVRGWNVRTGDKRTTDELRSQLSGADVADPELINRPWLALYCWTLWA